MVKKREPTKEVNEVVESKESGSRVQEEERKVTRDKVCMKRGE